MILGAKIHRSQVKSKEHNGRYVICNLPQNLDSLKVDFFTFKHQKNEEIKVYRDADCCCVERV